MNPPAPRPASCACCCGCALAGPGVKRGLRLCLHAPGHGQRLRGVGQPRLGLLVRSLGLLVCLRLGHQLLLQLRQVGRLVRRHRLLLRRGLALRV